jgi:competence protein ComEC
MKKLPPSFALLLIALLFGNGWVWHAILAKPTAAYSISFLDVGQGDSTLLTMGNVQMITDFGPDGKVVDSLGRAIPKEDRYIDLVAVTHPEQDHFGGLAELLKHYTVGAVIWTGRDRPRGESVNWDALLAVIKEKHIPMVRVGEGDQIAYGSSTVAILSPDPLLLGGGERNDAALVSKVTTPDFTALLTADIGQAVETYVAGKFDVSADILKVAHHGSRYSSGDLFLQSVNPTLAVIQSGKGNTYGHPHEEALDRIASDTSATVLRNDQLGTITITKIGEGLHVESERPITAK